jgi:hypothetical protein
MISRTTIGRDFGGVIRYQYTGRKEDPVDKRPELLAASGVGTQNAAEMIADFNMGRLANPNLSKAVWHTSLSFNPDDASRLDSAKMRVIAEDYLVKMGLSNTQYIIIRHHDQADNQHVHIIANRVDNDGKTIDDGKNFYLSKKALELLVADHQLTPIKGERPQLQNLEQLKGAELTKHEIRKVVRPVIAAATDLPSMIKELRANKDSVNVSEVINKQGKLIGLTFEKDGTTFKGAQLGRPFSIANIQQQLADNRATQVEAQRQVLREQTREVLTRTLYAAEPLLLDTKDYQNRVRKQGYQFILVTGQPPRIKHEDSGEIFTLAEVQPGGSAAPTLPAQVTEVLAQQAYAAKTLKMLEGLLATQDFTTRAEFSAQLQGKGYLTPAGADGGVHLRHNDSERTVALAGLKPFGRDLVEQVDEVVAIRQANLTHGRIGIRANDLYSADERLEHIRQELVAVGVKVEVLETTVPRPGLGPLAALAYTHETRGVQLDAVNAVMVRVQNSPGAAITEQSEGFGQPLTTWPGRKGQFGQATVVIGASETRSAAERAAPATDALRQGGATIREVASEQPGQVTLDVHYHTGRHLLSRITRTLDDLAHRSPGIQVNESEAARTVRFGEAPPEKTFAKSAGKARGD